MVEVFSTTCVSASCDIYTFPQNNSSDHTSTELHHYQWGLLNVPICIHWSTANYRGTGDKDTVQCEPRHTKVLVTFSLHSGPHFALWSWGHFLVYWTVLAKMWRVHQIFHNSNASKAVRSCMDPFKTPCVHIMLQILKTWHLKFMCCMWCDWCWTTCTPCQNCGSDTHCPWLGHQQGNPEEVTVSRSCFFHTLYSLHWYDVMSYYVVCF